MKPKPPIPESYWVEQGRLLAGEHPVYAWAPVDQVRRIDLLLQAGIDTFVDLTMPEEAFPYEDLLQRQAGPGIDYQRFPIFDFKVPTAPLMTGILDAIDDALQADRHVYVHCMAGIGRTGMTVGCYFVRRGLANAEAAAEVNRLYLTRPGSFFCPRSPENEEQLDFILNWWEDTPRGRKPYCEG